MKMINKRRNVIFEVKDVREQKRLMELGYSEMVPEESVTDPSEERMTDPFFVPKNDETVTDESSAPENDETVTDESSAPENDETVIDEMPVDSKKS